MAKKNIIQRAVQNIIGVEEKGVRAPFLSSITSRYGGGYFQQRKSYLEEYKNWVYACTTARAEEVANMQLKLYKGDTLIDSHEVLDLINKVNPQMTRYELFEATQAYKDLDGNAFWYLSRDKEGKGKIQEIYILRPDKVTIVVDPTNGLLIKGYVYSSPDGSKVPFEPNEILHHKTFNPLNYFPYPGRGIGVVEASITSIDTDNEARMWNAQFFKNGAKPDGVLTVDGDSSLDPDEYKRIKEEWNSEHQGSGNAHKVSILAGGLKWTETTRSQTDMDFINQRTFSRDEILALFRTPKSIIGITDDVNRANAEASIYVFALRTVKPLMQRLVETLNEFLLPEFGDDLYFGFVSPVAEDRAQVTNEYALGLDKWLTRNEIRALEGLSSTDNGDDFFGPMSMIPLDHAKPDGTKSVRETATKEKKTTTKRAVTIAEKTVDSFISKMPKSKKTYDTKSLSVLAKEKYIEVWKAQMHNSTLGLKKSLDNFFEEQEAEVLANVSEELKGLSKKEIVYKGVSDMLFDEDEAVSASISLITPYIKDYIKNSGENATVLVGATSFDATTPAIEKFIKERAKYFADSVNTTTGESLVRSITEGLQAGESIEDIRARVKEVYAVATDSRVDVIARTEVSAASNVGATNAYVQAGVEAVEWAVVSPEDVDCQENDGQVVKIGNEFRSGDEAPPVHPNCMCTLLPVFAE